MRWKLHTWDKREVYTGWDGGEFMYVLEAGTLYKYEAQFNIDVFELLLTPPLEIVVLPNSRNVVEE